MLEPLNFKAEITGNALNTLDQIQKMLNSVTDVKIAVNIDGLNDFKNFLKSDDFKEMLTPYGIIKTLDLKNPIYRETSTFGHFGRPTYVADGMRYFPWENLNLVDAFKQ